MSFHLLDFHFNLYNNINLKIQKIKELFNFEKTKVVAVSAKEKYNLETLVLTMIESLPSQKKPSFYDKTHQEVRSEESDSAIEKAWYEIIKEWASTIVSVAGHVASVVASIFSILKLFKK